MTKLVAVEEDEAPGRDLHGTRHNRGAGLASVQLVVQAARGLIEHAEEQRVAPAGIVRSVVVPAYVITRPRVEVQGVRVRIVSRRQLQPFARNLFQQTDERRRPIQLGDKRGELVQGMAADAAALLVARQIVAVDLRLDSIDGLEQPGRDIRREEVRQIEKRTLPYKLLPQALGIQTGQPRLIQALSLREIGVGLWRRCGSGSALVNPRFARVRRGQAVQATSEVCGSRGCCRRRTRQ